MLGIDSSSHVARPHLLTLLYRVALATLLTGFTTSAFAAISVSPSPSTGSYTVSWTSVPGANQYKLQESTNGGSSWSATYTVHGSYTSRSFSSKPVGTYTYKLRYCKDVYMRGEWFRRCFNASYPQVSVTVQAAAPPTPSGLTGPSTDYNGSYTISWNASSGATSYKLQQKKGSGSWVQVYSGSATSKAMSGNTAGTYYYRVQACSSSACSGWSSTRTVTVQAAPSTPAGLTGPGTDADGAYTISWNASANSSSYRLDEKVGSGSWVQIHSNSARSKAISGKSAGTYYYRVRGCNAESICSGYSSTVSVTVVQGPPTPSPITGPSTDEDGAFGLSWGSSSGALYYTLQRRLDGGAWNFTVDLSATSYNQTGLQDGTYQYRVRACNASVCSAYTASKTVTVAIPSPPPPPPPVPGTGSDPGASRESDETGTIAGNFRVDESGAATYSIPIVTAAGTAGVAPDISLNYSSGGGVGIAGMGWSVGGMSAITRCKQTYDQDRNPLPITWSASDRYCLDGQRLLLVSPGQSYGAANTIYRTEVDNGAIVTIRGSSSGEPDYFEVRRKDGSTSYYGKSPNDASNVNAKSGGGAGKTFIWAIRHFRDNIGNPIWFDYHNDSAGQRIKTIYWGFGTGRGPVSGHGARLEFHYVDRDDDRLGYVSGVALRTQKLLKEIRSYNVVGSAALIRGYTLYYNEGITARDKINRLTSIEECVGTTCLPRTTFEWNVPAYYTYLSQLSTRSLAESNNLSDLTLADINGDGMMDLVWLEGQPANAVFNFATSNGTSLAQRPFANNQMEYAPSGSAEKLTPIDYNLDGRDDIAYWDDNANRWKIIISAPYSDGSWRLKNTAYLTPIDDEDVTFVDIDSNGTTDAVWTTGTSIKQLRLSRLTKRPNAQPSSPIYYHFDTPVNIGSPSGATNGKLRAIAADLNGDGRIGIVMGKDMPFCEYEFDPPECFGPKYAYLLNITDPMSATPGYQSYANLNNAGSLWDNEHVQASGIVSTDVNADGLSDFFYPVYRDPNTNISQFHLAINRGNGSFDVREYYEPTMLHSNVRRPQFVDWNGDNFPDLMWKSISGSGDVYVRYWNPATNTFDPRVVATAYVNTSTNESVYFPDMNGDGVPDMLKIDTSNGAGNVTLYTRRTGGAIANRAANRIREISNGIGAKTTINYEPLSYSDHYDRMQVDTSQQPPGGRVHCIEVGEPGIEDLCVNQSVWEVSADGFYEQINGDWDLPSSMPSLKKTSPVIEASGPMYVVTDVIGSAPAGSLLTPGAVTTGATSAIEYHYYEAKVQAAGRGFLGFQQLRTVDTVAGASTTTRYRQDWPFTGLPIGTVVSSENGHIIGGGSTTWQALEWNATKRATAEANGTATLGPIHVEQVSNLENAYDLVNDGLAAGSLLSTTLTTTEYDAEANARVITVTTTNQVTGQDELIVTTTNEYDASSFSLWEARLKSTTVETNRSSFGGSTTRHSTFKYHASGTYRGMLYQEIIEPGHPNFELITTHSYDAYGNRKKSMFSDGTTTRCSAPSATTVYESSGRYVAREYDCLGRLVTDVVSRNAFGQPTRIDAILDASNTNSRLTTEIYYGALGREYFRTSEDGSFKTTYFTPNTTNCPSGSAYKSTTYTAGGGTSEVCYDVLARETRTLTLGFDGAWDAQDTIYDKKGRTLHKSEPYDLGSGAAYWNTVEYDLFDRPTRTTKPDMTWTEASYNGFNVETTISYESQKRIEKHNALGDVTEVVDNLGGRSWFFYDNLGNLRVTLDAGGNLTTTVHNDLGQKTLMRMPDSRTGAGAYVYEYNHFGELQKQTSPNGHTSDMTYDGLGRLKTRVDRINGGTIEASATWNYDTSPNGLGKLDNVLDSYSGYAQATLYDSLGRVDEVVTNFDGGAYFERTTYDEHGRVYQVFDAAGDGTFTDHGVVHEYGYYGHLTSIGDAVQVNGAPRTIYRRISAMNARGQVTAEQMGIGASGAPAITASYVFEDATGRLKEKNAYNRAGEHIQDLEYIWNDVGSLTRRTDTYHGSGAPNALSETFGYDGLNRLISHGEAGQAALSVDYDAVGNILEKSGVSGTYEYGTNASPYSVTRANGSNYYYDYNGNNTSGGGRTIAYSTFDKPTRISKGGNVVTFAYGVDRTRYRRVDSGSSNKTTRYIGNVEIIDHQNGNVERKRYIAGVAIETGYYTNGNETRRDTEYTLKDHLGSMDVITDDAGEILQKLSFGPWGQRRDASNWKEINTSNQLIDLGPTFDTSKTTRGFTGHEMVDSVGIVHMNGRIYDPILGRFLQADNYVQDAANTQSHNRYSYVWNNPLNATDPSGEFVFTLFAMVLVATKTIVDIYAIMAVFAIAGTLDALIAGADLSDAFLSGIISGVSAGAFAKIGSVLGGKMFKGSFAAGLNELGFAVKVFSHGMIGGITSVLQGGKFGHGFASAFVTAAATSFNNAQFIGEEKFSWKRVAIGATIGGTASKISGGKFANGAITGAFSQALNNERQYGPNMLGTFEEMQGYIEAEVSAQRMEKMTDVIFEIGGQKTIGKFTMSSATDGNGVDWALTVDGGIVSAGVATNIDGNVTISVSRGIGWQNVAGLSVGGSASTDTTVAAFVEGNIAQFQAKVGFQVYMRNVFRNVGNKTAAFFRGIENYHRALADSNY